jgi:serine/threonine protein kinase
MHGIVNEKSDIYAFGVILLELLSGRQAVDFSSKQSIVLWVSNILFLSRCPPIFIIPVSPSLITSYLENVLHYF